MRAPRKLLVLSAAAGAMTGGVISYEVADRGPAAPSIDDRPVSLEGSYTPVDQRKSADDARPVTIKNVSETALKLYKSPKALEDKDDHVAAGTKYATKRFAVGTKATGLCLVRDVQDLKEIRLEQDDNVFNDSINETRSTVVRVTYDGTPGFVNLSKDLNPDNVPISFYEQEIEPTLDQLDYIGEDGLAGLIDCVQMQDGSFEPPLVP